jgi:hypothetical protein
MSVEWGLFPLAMDESDLMMLILALFVLSLLVIGMFIVFPLFYALLVTFFIILGILYGVWTLTSKQDSSD